MIGGVTRQEELPGLSDQVTPSARTKFCRVNVSSGVAEDGFELTCLLTANAKVCISLKVTIKSDNTERLQQEQQVREENHQITWFDRCLFLRA